MQRLTGGPGPEADLANFSAATIWSTSTLKQSRSPTMRAPGSNPTKSLGDMHPISRACTGFHFLIPSGMDYQGESMDAVVTARRIAAGAGEGAVFPPLAMGGAGRLRVSGTPGERVLRRLDGIGVRC